MSTSQSSLICLLSFGQRLALSSIISQDVFRAPWRTDGNIFTRAIAYYELWCLTHKVRGNIKERLMIITDIFYTASQAQTISGTPLQNPAQPSVHLASILQPALFAGSSNLTQQLWQCWTTIAGRVGLTSVPFQNQAHPSKAADAQTPKNVLLLFFSFSTKIAEADMHSFQTNVFILKEGFC